MRTFLFRLSVCAFTLLAVVAGPQNARADVLYAASGAGNTGTLYTINPSNGAVISSIGPLQTANGTTVGITGLAFHPTTGVLYGATSNQGTLRSHLVTINTATGLVTDVGAFSVAGTLSDISFDSSGALFGWESSGAHQLQAVNVATGATTPIGTNSTGIFGGGGLAVDANGNIYITPDGTTNNPSTLKTVDDTTGNFLTSINLSGHPLSVRNIGGLDFDSLGVLFGTNLDGGVASRLVTINTATGAITDIGALPLNIDAIAFLRAEVPEPASLLAVTVASVVGGCSWLIRRRKS